MLSKQEKKKQIQNLLNKFNNEVNGSKHPSELVIAFINSMVKDILQDDNSGSIKVLEGFIDAYIRDSKRSFSELEVKSVGGKLMLVPPPEKI